MKSKKVVGGNSRLILKNNRLKVRDSGLRDYVLLSVLMFLLVLVIMISSVHAEQVFGGSTGGEISTGSYVSSNVQYGQPGFFGSGSYDYDIDMQEYREVCKERQDFVVQVAPGGCTPAVVRSDLLAERNVPVFCQLQAVQINPTIDTERIRNMRITHTEGLPQGVAGVSYQRPRAALSRQYGESGFATLSNIGYAVIILKQQPDERAMPGNVTGKLSAHIDYSVPIGFGMGVNDKIIPVLSDEEWNQNYKEYGFMNGKGYIRVDEVESSRARISIYRDVDSKIDSFTIERGRSSGEKYLPGFYCNAAYTVELIDAVSPETKVKLTLDNDEYEVYQGEKFADNTCVVSSIDSKGFGAGVVWVRCNGKRFPLELKYANVKLEVDGVDESFAVDDIIHNLENRNKDVLLYNVGRWTNKEKTPFIILYVEPDETQTKGVMARIVRTTFRNFAKGLDWIAKQLAKLGSGLRPVGSELHGIVVLFEGDEYEFSDGTKIKFTGFVDTENLHSGSSTFETHFQDSVQGYKTVEAEHGGLDFPNEQIVYGQKALENAVVLATDKNKQKTLFELATQLKEKYPESNKYQEVLETIDVIDTSMASHSFNVDGISHTMTLRAITEPGYEDVSIDLNVGGKQVNLHAKGDDIIVPEQEKGKFREFFEGAFGGDANEYMYLKDFDSESIKVAYKCPQEGVRFERTKRILVGEKVKICNRDIFLREIDVDLSARIKLNPINKHVGSKVEFSYGIGIEKRAIELNPEKTKERIEKLNETIAKWEGINEGIGKTVKGMKAACFATSAALQVKNLFTNLGGKALARQTVMGQQGQDGWNKHCLEEAEARGISFDKCIFDNADEIEKDVQAMSAIISAQNNRIKQMESRNRLVEKGGFLDSAYVDTEKSAQINSGVLNRLLRNKGYDEQVDPSYVSYSEQRELERDLLLLEKSGLSDVTKDVVEKRLENNLQYIGEAQQRYDAAQQAESEAGSRGIAGLLGTSFTQAMTEKPVQEYLGAVTTRKNNFYGVGPGKEIHRVVYDDNEYYVTLTPIREGANRFMIDGIFYPTGDPIYESEEIYSKIKKEYPLFEKFTSESYNNPYPAGSAEVKYYETEPYKGMPAIVPFDLQNGWYAATRPTLPGFGKIKAFTDSGRVTSFWVCNIGENKKQEFNIGIGDDVCQQFNVNTKQPIDQFPGLSRVEARRLVENAMKALNEAANKYKAGIDKVRISGAGTMKVGRSMASISGTRCTDFMSPKDCKLLFNVCDPVLCPSSRCNLGGKYQVDNVVQTGIVGGMFLCLPNYKEGIYMPVCLTGIHAGIENYVSILRASKSCLEENLESGRYVGICDQITAIYKCEFFWRQISPLVNVIIPKLLEFVTGQGGARGGGEYLNVMSAWENMQSSINYFKNEYSVNAMKSFQARSTAEAGTQVCKSFLSVAFPKKFDILIEPDSPTQFSAWFNEIPMSDAPTTAQSHYKVFYHIFAGNDQGAHYSVYLTDRPGAAGVYQSGSFMIATGYASRGEYVSESIDKVGPSGYLQLCVRINAQEECGFKQVSTSFALNYARDKYIQNQATKDSVRTEKECISGKPSLLTPISPNLQATAEEVAMPQLYQRGVVRVCSTDNPGSTTEPKRWVEVGVCGDSKIKCWVDTKSIDDAITDANTGVLDATLDELNEIAEQNLEEQKRIRSDEELAQGFSQIENEITKLNENAKSLEDVQLDAKVLFAKLEAMERINLLTDVQHARVIFNKARVDAIVAEKAYAERRKEIQETIKPPEDSDEEGYHEGEGDEECLENGKRCYVNNDCCSKNCDFTDTFPARTGICREDGEDSDKILNAASKLEGKKCDDCWIAVKDIYEEAGFDYQCVYSDNAINPDLAKPSCSQCNDCQIDLYEDLEKGDILQIYNKNAATGEHNLIFAGWKDKNNKIAYEWSQRTRSKGIEYGERNLEENPITVVWKPILKRGMEVEDGEEIEEGAEDVEEEIEEEPEQISVPVFEYKYGIFQKNVFYRFNEEKQRWEWKFKGNKLWSYPGITQAEARPGQSLDPGTNHRKFVLSLKEKDYLQGITAFVTRLGQDSNDPLSLDPVLRLYVDDRTYDFDCGRDCSLSRIRERILRILELDKELTLKTNFVENGDFEDGIDSRTKIPKEWVISPNDDADFYQLIPDEDNSYLRIDTLEEDYKNLIQIISINKRGVYEFGGKMKSKNIKTNDRDYRCIIKLYSESPYMKGDYIFEDAWLPYSLGDIDWRELKNTISIPKDNYYIDEFKISIGANLKAEGEECYFDDVYVKRIGDIEITLPDLTFTKFAFGKEIDHRSVDLRLEIPQGHDKIYSDFNWVNYGARIPLTSTYSMCYFIDGELISCSKIGKDTDTGNLLNGGSSEDLISLDSGNVNYLYHIDTSKLRRGDYKIYLVIDAADCVFENFNDYIEGDERCDGQIEESDVWNNIAGPFYLKVTR